MAIDLRAKTVPSTIVLKGELGERHEEARAGGTIRPGHLIMGQNNSGTMDVVVHGTAGGYARPWIAKEDQMNQGHGKTDAYSSGDLVAYHVAQPGDVCLCRLAASATAVVAGDKMTSAGDGTFKKASGSDVVIAAAEESVDNSSGGSEAFIRLIF